MSQPTIVVKYGVYDNLRKQGLSNWTYPEWDATIPKGGFYLFDTHPDAAKCIKRITTLLKKAGNTQPVEYLIFQITTEITITNNFKIVETIKK